MGSIVQFPGIKNGIDKGSVFSYLINLNTHLNSESEVDYALYFSQLTSLIDHYKVEPKLKTKTNSPPPTDEEKLSLNIYKVVSRNLMLILHHMSNRVHDLANDLLGNIQLSDADEVNGIMSISTIILIDLFETFPTSLTSINNFAINQIYKIIKKSPGIDSSLIYLLNSITKNASKLDIDEKMQQKLLKLVSKQIIQLPISYNIQDTDAGSTVLLKKNYILCYKNFLLLSISTHYENLLALSTSSTSAGSKMKPEAIMTQQNQFQINLLSSNEKILHYCLSNYNKELRVASIDLLANLLLNLVPTGKFNAIEYLIATMYPLPSLNCWDDSLSTVVDHENDSISIDVKKEKNHLNNHDSNSHIHSYTETLLFQSSIIETLVVYIQLEQFQNSEFLSSNLILILDHILVKFGELSYVKNHIQNQHWNKIMIQWSTLIDFIVKDTGSSCYEVLTGYIYSKFNLDYNNEKSAIDTDTSAAPVNKRSSVYAGNAGSRASFSLNRKRESTLFGFKGKSSSKSRSKDSKVKEIRPYHNSYQAYFLLYIFEMLIPYGINFNSVIQSKSRDEKKAKSLELSEEVEAERALEEEGEESKSQEKNSFIREILFKLITNDNSYIRNYALKSLLLYARVNQVEINLLILHAFKMVNQEYKTSEEKGPSTEENISGKHSTRLISCSLVLSALIKQTDSILLQNSTIVKILSFCTQNLKHNNTSNRNNFLNNSACWIILSSLVTFYNDSEFVKLNSSQFLVFWKSLLTSQFISTNVSDPANNQTKEIIENLKLRNFSLVCLLNYISSVELSPESLKQLQFLLTKSYNYLTYLESNLESVGSYTNFNSQSFNETDYNPNLINNIQFADASSLSSDRVLISLILYSKKIILQSYTKLATLLKHDINSNMMIFLIKIFSDSKIFSRIISPEFEKTKGKSTDNASTRINDFDDDTIILGEDYNYSFGVTSKFQVGDIDELLIKDSAQDSRDGSSDEVSEFVKFRDSFTKSLSPPPLKSIETQLDITFQTWIDYFENLVFKSVDHSINYDPNIFLTRRYSVFEEFSPNLITSLIDLSVELFQLVFPNLSLQIQISLLEQIRNSLTSKSTDPLRLKAIQVNISVAIHGLLNNCSKRKLVLDPQILKIIGEILFKIESRNTSLVKINTNSIGLVYQTSSKQVVGEAIDKLINDIVKDSNPYTRGFSIIALARIFQYTKLGFNSIFNIGCQLLKDPNPIVYHYSLESMTILFDSNIDCINFIPDTLTQIFSNYLNDSFGYDIQNKTLVNLKCKFNSPGAMTHLLKIFVTSLGPRLREIPVREKTMIKNLIVALSNGVGLTTIDDYTSTYKHLLSLFQELIIFDPKLIEDEVEFFTELLNLIISKTLKVGLTSMSPSSLLKDSIFPFTSSIQLYHAAYECYVELIKIYGVKVLSKDTVNLLWISMNLKPCEELKSLIILWLESSLDMNWFVILNSLFKFSSKKLVGPFIEANYQQKLLPLQQRQKKKTLGTNGPSNVFKDEEIENIVGNDGDNVDKNEPITWEFKLFIYELMNRLLDLAGSGETRNSNLFNILKDKIQEIVKISFLGSTSPISIVKLQGINLLDKVLGLFGNLSDPLYPSTSILEQQQAQIISALIPCFNGDNDTKVIVNTINVSSKFINLPRIKFYSKQRILKTLIYLLEEISASKFLKFGFLENMSEFGRKSIQLSILNCWAMLKIDSEEDKDSTEPDLLVTLDKYSKLLTSLWILVLRDFSTLKFNDNSNKELEIYGNYWINFISVLSIELDRNPEFIAEYLSGDEQNFFFVMFSQCVESLIKNNKNKTEILMSMKRLVRSADLVELIFHDEIFGELIDLFDRLILIDDNVEFQCELIDIISTIANTYITSKGKKKESFENGFDKLFELIRVGMLPLFTILPFLRSDFDATNQSQILTLKHCDSAPNLLILKKTFEKLIEIMAQFPDVVKIDLYSCLLFIFAKIYEYKNELLISVVLPHIKQVISESLSFEVNLVKSFSEIIRGYYQISKDSNYSVITSMLLITSGDIQLKQQESIELSDALIGLLGQEESATMSIQCIKTLNQYSIRTNKEVLVMKYLMTQLIKLLSEQNKQVEPKIAFEILFMFTKTFKDDVKVVALYSILIPLLLRYNDNDVISREYLHSKLMFLVQLNPQSFKVVVTERLSGEQKTLAEELVKLKATSREIVDEDEGEIELKQFG